MRVDLDMGLNILRALCLLLCHFKVTRPQHCTAVNGVKVIPVCEAMTCNGRSVIISNNATYYGTSVTCSCDVTIQGAYRALIIYTSPGYPYCGIHYDVGSWRFSCQDTIIHLETISSRIVFHKTAETQASSNFKLSIETAFSLGELVIQCFPPSTTTPKPKQTSHNVYSTTFKSYHSTKSVESVQTSTVTSSIPTTPLASTRHVFNTTVKPNLSTKSVESSSTSTVTSSVPTKPIASSRQVFNTTVKPNQSTKSVESTSSSTVTSTVHTTPLASTTFMTSKQSTSIKQKASITSPSLSTSFNITTPATTNNEGRLATDATVSDGIIETTRSGVLQNTAITSTFKSSTSDTTLTSLKNTSNSDTPASSTAPLMYSTSESVTTDSPPDQTPTDTSINVTQQASRSSSTINRRVLTWSIAGCAASIFALTIIVMIIVKVIRKRRILKQTLNSANSSFIDAFNNFTYETPNVFVAGDNTQGNNIKSHVAVLDNLSNTPSDWSISTGSVPAVYNWDSPEEDVPVEVSHSYGIEAAILHDNDDQFETAVDLRPVFDSDNSFSDIYPTTGEEFETSGGDTRQEPEHVKGPVNSDIYAIVTKRNSEIQFEPYMSTLISFKTDG